MDRNEPTREALNRHADDAPRRGTHVPVVAAILGLLFVLYAPVVGFDFLNWDDGWYVTNNELIRSWSLENLYRVFTEPSVKNYAPLTTFSLLIDHTLWGDAAGGYHVTNLLLHAVNAVLVYALLWRLTGSRMIAAVTAALFALHPVQVESVAWVSSRKGLLSATFLLLSLICWLRKERTARDEGYGLLFLLLALLAKAIAAVVPAVVLSYDVWIRRKPLAESVARQFVPGLLAVMFLLLTVSSQTTMYGGVRGHMSLGTFHILAIDAVILWKYAGSLVWPSALCVLYDPPTDGIAWAVAMAVAGWAVVVTAVYRLRRRWPYLRWALLTAFLFLVPVLNLVPITTLMNDRYLYLPCVPLFALFAAGTLRVSQLLANVLGRGVSHGMSTACARGFAGVLVAAALGASAMCTRNYLPVWRNGLTLWTHAERHLPDLPAVNYQLADAHYRAGRKRRAVSLLEHALAQGNADDGDRIRFAKTLSQWRNRDAER